MRNACIVSLLIAFLAACGGQDKQAQTQQAQSLDSVPAEIMAQVPKYLIQRTNMETGVVEFASTNEAPLQADLSTEEGRLAYGKFEAERFERGTIVSVQTLTGDEDADMLKSSESFWYGGWGFGGLGYGFGYGLGGWGFGYAGLGGCGFGGWGYQGFGLAGLWGAGCGVGFGGCGYW